MNTLGLDVGGSIGRCKGDVMRGGEERGAIAIEVLSHHVHLKISRLEVSKSSDDETCV